MRANATNFWSRGPEVNQIRKIYTIPVRLQEWSCWYFLFLELLVPGTRSWYIVGHRGYPRANDIGIWCFQPSWQCNSRRILFIIVNSLRMKSQSGLTFCKQWLKPWFYWISCVHPYWTCSVWLNRQSKWFEHIFRVVWTEKPDYSVHLKL